MAQRIEEIREVVAEVLELEPSEITDQGDFREQYEADSIRAIEILSRLEKKYKIVIPQTELPEMQNVQAVYKIISFYAGWREPAE